MARIILITGGSRSGKSAFAQQLAESISETRIYLATCPVVDGEMAARIARHRRDREDRSWLTIEEETALAGALGWGPDTGVIVVDCLTLWINNLMYGAEQRGETLTEDDIAYKAREVLRVARFGAEDAAAAGKADPEVRATANSINHSGTPSETLISEAAPSELPAGAQATGPPGMEAPPEKPPPKPGDTASPAFTGTAATAPPGTRTVIFVTNEVGMGIVPEHPGGRLFRDLAGRCNQVFAREADTVAFMVSGIPMWIKGKSPGKK